MFKLLREYLSIMILKERHETMRQATYDAIAWAVERSLRDGITSDEERLSLTLQFLSQALPGIDHTTAIMYIEAIQAKLLGVGADPRNKV